MKYKYILVTFLIFVSLSGCTALTEYESPPVTVQENTLDESPYEQTDQEQIIQSQRIPVDEIDQEISIISWNTNYEKRGDLGIVGQNKTISTFSVLSTPSVRISDREFNPLVHRDDEYILNRIEEKQNNIEIHNKTDEKVLENITVNKYDADLTVESVSIESTVLVSRLRLNNSYVIASGAYPKDIDGGEDEILKLMKHLEEQE